MPSEFHTPEAQRVSQRADQLRNALRDALHWTRIEGTPGFDAKKLQEWRRDVEMLRRSAARPPAVGLFGESQMGKSFLVSAFSSGDSGRLQVQDPADPERGIDFLESINAEHSGDESTAVVCRFTAYPVDRPLEAGADRFVGRVLSLCDLLLSLALGYQYEIRSVLESAEFAERLEEVRAHVLQAKWVPRFPEGQTLEQMDTADHSMRELAGAWSFLTKHHGDKPYVRALARVGFGELLTRPERPTGEGWTRLVGMLWGGGTLGYFDQLYAKLESILIELDYPHLVEIATADVCRSREEGREQDPIIDVYLLDRVFEDEFQPVTVWARHDQDDRSREARITRPLLCALLSELALPVQGPFEGTAEVLEQADLLDFPGARSPQLRGTEEQAGEHELDESDRVVALKAFRRGKLTRLFSLLTEQREISLLCLVASHEKKEATMVVRPLLDNWIDKHCTLLTSNGTPAQAELFLVVTKADLMINPPKGGGIAYNTSRLGDALRNIRNDYALGSEDRAWMDHWPPPPRSTAGGNERAVVAGSPFQQVYFFHSPLESIDRENTEHLARSYELYKTDEAVRRYVGAPEAKWTSVINDGGVGLLSSEVSGRVGSYRKPERLDHELESIRSSLYKRLVPLHVAEDGSARRAEEARAAGERDFRAILLRSVHEGRNPVSTILQVVSLQPETIGRLLDDLDRKAGHLDEDGVAIEVTFSRFYSELTMRWQAQVREGFDREETRLRLGVEEDVVSSLRSRFLSLPEAQMPGTQGPWLMARLDSALEPYFQAIDGIAHDGLSMAACWIFNRIMVGLGPELPEGPAEVELPPSLSPRRPPRNVDLDDAAVEELLAQGPPWFWMLRHWRQRMPALYEEIAGGATSIPPGNAELQSLLNQLEELGKVGNHA